MAHSNNHLSRFYQNLLIGTVDETMQSRILNYGLRHKDYVLLAELASFDGLSASVDAELGKVAAAKVRSAWIRAAHRTKDEIAASISNEKRPTVLTVIAESEDGLPETAFSSLLDCAEGSRSSYLALCVAANPTAPDTSRARAASLFGRFCGQLRRNEHAKLPAAIRFAEQMALEVTNRDLASFLTGSSDLSEAALDNLVKVLVATPLEQMSYWSYNSELSALSRVLEQPLVSVDMAKTIEGFATRALTASQSRYGSSSSAQTLVDKAKESIKKGGGSGVLSDNLATTTDAAVIARTVEGLVNGKIRSEAVAMAVISNPLLSDEQFERLVAEARSVFGWTMLSSLARMVTNDVKRVATVLWHHPHFIDDSALVAMSHPEQVFITLCTTRGSELPSWVLERIIASKYFNAEIAAKLPVSLFRGSHLNEAAAEKIIALLAQIVSDDQMWGTFETLAPEFEGSIEELLTTARLLSGS